MIKVTLQDDDVVIFSEIGDLAPRHENQLAYWGFKSGPTSSTYISTTHDTYELFPKIITYFKQKGITYTLNDKAQLLLHKCNDIVRSLNNSIDNGRRFKEGAFDSEETREFLHFIDTQLNRPLKEHQCKAALHLLKTINGANFSVPGSGKTAVVLSVFHRLRQLGDIDSLFVIGPPACFGPWRKEYEEVLGAEPDYEILAGGNIELRRCKYFANKNTVCDLYLTTFQTLQRDWQQVQTLFNLQGIRFYLVVDEAHYIKQIGGIWAEAVLNVSKHAIRRCILTGTPFPQNHTDAFNLFEVLWPGCSPITVESRHRIERHIDRREHQKAAEILDASIGPLFYRVRKADLGLAPQVFCDPTQIRMNKYERLIYDSIVNRIRVLSCTDYLLNEKLLVKLRQGRMIRLRQCLSYVTLLGSAIIEYNEDLTSDNISLAEVIKNYNNLEIPAKLEALLALIRTLRMNGEKVVVWSNFVRTLEYIQTKIEVLGHGVRLIYGDTPVGVSKINDELSREEIIQEFIDPISGIDVLVANPAACAESISLHKTCSHAIYYDISYNCAQYIQSLDRIHRVGGSEQKPAYYHVLQYEDTIDEDILANVRRKAKNMNNVIDKDYAIYSLDMFEGDEDIDAYERVFGK